MRKASDQERRHFEAIAAAERESEAQRVARAAETPPGERILLGAELSAGLRWTPAFLAELDARTDGQMELARRRVALSLDGGRTR